jgi:hypothetical protein
VQAPDEPRAALGHPVHRVDRRHEPRHDRRIWRGSHTGDIDLRQLHLPILGAHNGTTGHRRIARPATVRGDRITYISNKSGCSIMAGTDLRQNRTRGSQFKTNV